MEIYYEDYALKDIREVFDKYGIDIHSMKVENLKNKSMFLEMETYVNKGFQKESLVEEMMNKTYFKMLNYY
ncbi:mg2+ transporter-C family protein [Coprobacillus sp. CAG:183]|mgnify:FL=1|nr:mg2+ transporter-C family protein [Coprobacillus sp. CAG:183]